MNHSFFSLRAYCRVGAACGGVLMLISASVAADQDPQIWTMQSIAQRLDYGLEAVLNAEQRYGISSGQAFRRNELTPQIIWHYSPRYDFGLGYERMDQWDADGGHASADEGLFFATVHLPWRDWKLTSRQRFQFGVEEGQATGVFRHRVQMAYVGKRLPLGLEPFVANEWFFNLLEGELVANRFWGGLRYPVHRRLEIEIFGMRVDEWNNTRSFTTPVAGLAINLQF